jgi:solute carrier family 25 folate transporter 32
MVNTIATTLCHPIDVVKTTYQTTNHTIYNSTKKVLQNRSFFRGLTPNLGTYPVFWGVYFQTQANIRQYTDKSVFNNFLTSYISGNVASLISNPLFTMKVQMQTSKYGYLQTIQNIGIRGLYAGFPATTLNNLKLGIQFPLYEYLKDFYGIGMSAFVAKFIATSIMYPLDLVRVQQRKQLNTNSIYNILQQIYLVRGIRGWYRGIILYNSVSTSQFVLMMYGMEWIKSG